MLLVSFLIFQSSGGEKSLGLEVDILILLVTYQDRVCEVLPLLNYHGISVFKFL